MAFGQILDDDDVTYSRIFAIQFHCAAHSVVQIKPRGEFHSLWIGR